MFDGNWRETVEKGVDPVGAALQRLGMSADVLTTIGIAMAAASAVIIGSGRLFLGFIAMLAAGIPDLLDGAVAKASGATSKRGAFFDSTSDRLSDVLVFGGIAWYLDSNEPGRISILPFAVMGAALITSYVRAKGELLGYDAKGGIMERAERFILISVGLVFSSILIPVLWVMLVLSSVTIMQRFAKVWKQATVEKRAAAAAPS